jgi:transcriptional regulator with XRE-family HTH domain
VNSETLERAIRICGSAADLARRLGVPSSTVRSWRAGKTPGLESQAKLAAIVPPVDTVPEGHRLKRVSTMSRPDGSVIAQWTISERERENQAQILERLMRDLPETVPVRARASELAPGSRANDLLAVYPLGDPHIGLLAWAPETGADFDLKIAETLMTGAMRDLVLRGPRAEQALIVNCGDFFHADNAAGHTTKGDHALDLDGRAPRVLAVGFAIMVALIDAALEHHGRVVVDNRIGNHDGHTALMLAIGLAAHYRNDPRVTIPPTVSHRSYHEFGANLIGVTHGDRTRGEDLEAIMASEQAPAWGRTLYRKWIVGHVHHSTVRELRGCTIETFRTLAARDSWHAAQGYCSGRDMHRIVLHRHHGEISREVVNVRALLAGWQS